MKNSNVFDLYSGTGSFGLECLSRKAKIVYFVENNQSALEALKKNIERFSMEKKSKIFEDNVFFLTNKDNLFNIKFDLIFCDPPFKDKNIGKLINLIFNQKIINKNGILIIHRNKNTVDKFPNCFKVLEERVYGISKVIYGKFLF